MKDIHEMLTEFKADFPHVYADHETLLAGKFPGLTIIGSE